MKKPKILIVDDEATVVKALKKALETDGYEFVTAKDGKEGLKIFKKEKPDLVFLDLRMPVMSGTEFLAEIKIQADDPYQVVIITGHGDEEDIEKCYALGVNSFLRKPLSMVEIRGLAKKLIHLKQIEMELRQHRDNLQSLVEDRTAALEEQLHLQQTLIDAIPIPIYYKDTNLNYLGCNVAFEEAFGTSKAEVAGKSINDFTKRKGAKIDRQMDLELLQDHEPKTYQSSLLFSDEKKHDVAYYTAVYLDRKGKVAGIVGTIFDVTEREKSKKKLANKLDSYDESNMSLRVLLKQLADAQEEGRTSGIPNIKELVLPNKDQLESILSSPQERAYIDNIMLNLNRVTSPFAKKLSGLRLGLSPKEIQVADLIRIGLSNKESALQLGVTKSTVEFHRDNLRKKLNLKHEKKNLRSYLMALDCDLQV